MSASVAAVCPAYRKAWNGQDERKSKIFPHHRSLKAHHMMTSRLTLGKIENSVAKPLLAKVKCNYTNHYFHNDPHFLGQIRKVST